MKPNVVLFTLPPYSCKTPNPAFSILKANLEYNGFNTEVKYLNIDLNKDTSNISGVYNEFNELSPYMYLLKKLFRSEQQLEELRLRYFSAHAEKYCTDQSLKDVFWFELLDRINSVFDDIIEAIDVSSMKLFGFSEKFYQWVPAILFSEKLKKKYPDIPIIVGGFGDKNKAQFFVEKIKYFDYATWGEGEDVLVKLCEQLSKKEDRNLANVPRLIYNSSDGCVSTSCKSSYLELNEEILPDYSDYFLNLGKLSDVNIRLPIETNRGCHWCRCKFCYLNQGYKYRESSVSQLIKSIEELVNKYNCYDISFVDNDIIGLSIQKFEYFLDELIELRRKLGNKLSIKVAEVIPFRRDSKIIKKMALAGFENIQIGYEAVTDSLLKKMSKKQSFALNLFLIKFCKKYNIKISGANIIADIIGETNEDILESVNNLHYLRFLFGDNYYKHQVINLCLSKNSRFYKEALNELDQWNISWLYDNLPEKFKEGCDKFAIFDFQKNECNPLWGNFEELSNYYYSNNFSYQIFQNDKQIEYREYFNGKEIKSLLFEEGYYWDILSIANNQVRNLEEVCIELNKLYQKEVDQKQVKEQIEEMKSEFIIYSDADFDCIVTIINTEEKIP